MLRVYIGHDFLHRYNVNGYGINFRLKLRDRMVLVSGDSATGKTLLYKAIMADSIVNQKEIVLLNHEHNKHWMIDCILDSAKHQLIVIDDADLILNDEQKIKISLDNDNQYIIMCHTSEGFLPNDKSFAELKIENKKGRLEYWF